MTRLEKLIIRDLYKSVEGLYIFTLYRRFNVAPKDLFQAVINLKEKSLLTDEDMRLNLTSEGKEFVLLHNIVIKRQRDKFSNFPDGILGPRININEFYLPKVTNFDK